MADFHQQTGAWLFGSIAPNHEIITPYRLALIVVVQINEVSLCLVDNRFSFSEG